MKIAFLVGTFPSLSETFILNQIVGLVERGYDVDIYAAKAEVSRKVHPDIYKYDLLNKVYYQPSLPRNYSFRIIKAIFLYIECLFICPLVLLKCLNIFAYGKQALSLRLFYATIPFAKNSYKKYKLLHCHFANLGLKGVCINEVANLNMPILTTFHGYDLNVIHRDDRNIYNLLFEKGSCFTAGSSFMMERAISLGCPKNKLFKVEMGINISNYEFRPKIFQRDKPIKILTVARLVEKKGLEYSIQAVAKTMREFPNIEFKYQIAGEGFLRPSLEALIKALGLSESIELLGWQTNDEVQELYENSHIFILSSVTASNGDKEGQGLVLQEAQSMGLPVLATIHNGFPDSIQDGISGFLVPERDIDSLSEKLSYLTDNPEQWLIMGLAGRAFVEKNFDDKILTNKIIDAYKTALNLTQVVSFAGEIEDKDF